MRARCWALTALALAAGCQPQDENPNWSPAQDYPSWAYDAPFYHRPGSDLPVAETIGDDIPVYFSGAKRFYIKHPGGHQLPHQPRIAVWYSIDEGRHWERAGYYGVEQTHFLFETEAQGPHWIRFHGPGQRPAQSSPAGPNRVYIVDTSPPVVFLALGPPAIERDERGEATGAHVYAAGERVTLRWEVSDCHLQTDSIRMATCFGTFPESLRWEPLPQRLAPSGRMTLPIPPEASRPGGGRMRVRLEARDRAGNVNYAYSPPMTIAGEGAPEARPGPVPPPELIAQEHGPGGARPGWPDPGTLLRGGASRVLDWLPRQAEKQQKLALQFSANNGRSWRTVAEDLHFGKRTRWTVPEVNSRICRLRVVAVRPDGREIMLAHSAPFTVHTAPGAIHRGPEPVAPGTGP